MPGGAAGLQNQSGGRQALGGFDSLPSPPRPSGLAASEASRLRATGSRPSPLGTTPSLLRHALRACAITHASDATVSVRDTTRGDHFEEECS